MLSFKNKRGDIESIIYTIVILFIAGFILVFLSMFALDIYGRLGEGLDAAGYNNTEARDAIITVEGYENSIWDYVFLAIAISYTISLMILAYSTQTNPIYYVIYGLIASFGFIVAVVFANIWEKLAEAPQMVETIARFPITNLILDNYFPLFITVIILSVMVLLFGKYVGAGEGGLG